MNIISTLLELYNDNLVRAIVITCCLLLIFSLLIWVSIIDIKRKTITFWKMLIVGFSIIISPIIGAFFCGCGLLKWILLISIPIYIFFLFINIKFNHDKFIGKADMDILYSIFSINIAYGIWLYIVSDNMTVFGIRFANIWYITFLYLVLGGLLFIFITIIIFIIKRIFLKKPFNNIMKTRLPVIIMFTPACIAVPLTIMLS